MPGPMAVLTVQRQVPTASLAEALAEAGATGLRAELGCGDSGAGVERYFAFAFRDPGAEREDRFAQGFICLCSEEHEDGWTHLRLGSDERGREIVATLALILGGTAFDERSGHPIPQPEPRPALAM